MKLVLNARKISLGKKIITSIQNKRRKEPVINMLRHTNNAFAAKHPRLAQKTRNPGFFESMSILIGLLQIDMPKFAKKTSINHARYKGFRNLDFD